MIYQQQTPINAFDSIPTGKYNHVDTKSNFKLQLKQEK